MRLKDFVQTFEQEGYLSVNDFYELYVQAGGMMNRRELAQEMKNLGYSKTLRQGKRVFVGLSHKEMDPLEEAIVRLGLTPKVFLDLETWYSDGGTRYYRFKDSKDNTLEFCLEGRTEVEGRGKDVYLGSYPTKGEKLEKGDSRVKYLLTITNAMCKMKVMFTGEPLRRALEGLL
jgi:hypothetical protein